MTAAPAIGMSRVAANQVLAKKALHLTPGDIRFSAVALTSIGAAIPVLFGRETVGQLETFTEAVPKPA